MKPNKLLIVLGLMTSLSSFAQHDFTFKVDGIKDTTIYLANYFAGKMYYNDTTRADENGVIKFKGENTKPGGIYAVIFPDNKTYFEFVVNEPVIEMKTTFENPVKDMKVVKSEENKAFYEYMHFISSTQAKLQPLQTEKQSAEGQKKKDIEKQIAAIQEDAERYKAAYLAKYKGLFAVKVLNTSEEVTVPEFKKENGEMDDVKRYQYYKANYFNNVDLSDDRLLRTPVLDKKITYYLTKLTPQIPDSVNAAIDYLVSKTADTSLMFKYIIQYSTGEFEKSQIMGMDAVFVHVAEKYYETGKAYWVEEDKLNDILETYYTRKNLLIGLRAENIVLMDVDSNWVSLYDVKAKYTVLVFWDPNCGHCKKEMPKLQELYKKEKANGLEIFAVSTEFDNKDWPKYIKENNFTWIDVSDNPEINKNATKYIIEGKTTLNSLNFRDYWDIYSTPQFYLLDENKMIIAKKINADQIPDFIKQYEERLGK